MFGHENSFKCGLQAYELQYMQVLLLRNSIRAFHWMVGRWHAAMDICDGVLDACVRSSIVGSGVGVLEQHLGIVGLGC